MSDASSPQHMSAVAALQALADSRRAKQIVVTNQGSARLWPQISEHPLDLNYNPSAMGGAIPLGLGLALARPDHEVIVISGDGSLLMNLGSLVTVVGTGVTNLTIVLLDNGIYEVTGGQKTAASDRNVDFAGLARAAGFPNVAQFARLEDWQRHCGVLVERGGPRFVWLSVLPLEKQLLASPTPPIAAQLDRLQRGLRE